MSIIKIPSKKYKYTYQVDLRYKDAYGVTQRYIKSGFRKKYEAKQHEASIIARVNNNISITQSNRKTFDDVFQEYMEVEGKVKYAPATVVYYKRTYEQYIDSKLRNYPIESLNYVAMQRYINNLAKKQNFPTLLNVKKVFSITMNYAMRNNYISHNQVSQIVLPNKEDKSKQPETISDEDLDRIIDEMIKSKQPNYQKRKLSLLDIHLRWLLS